MVYKCTFEHLRIAYFHMVVQLRPLDAYNARNLNNIRDLFLQVKQTVEYVYIIYNIITSILHLLQVTYTIACNAYMIAT